MRKNLLPFFAVAILVSFAFTPILNADSKTAAKATTSAEILEIKKEITEPVKEENSVAAATALLYDSLNLGKLGLSLEAIEYAYTGYKKMLKKGQLNNTDILTVCDFSQRSDKKRMYIIDVKNFKLLTNTYVAHGKNSGLQYAQKFSNTPESLQSSLGFYTTKATYFGKHGLSLRLDGKEPGFNDKAEARAIVLHGAEYIGEHRLGAPYMGRSFGCPAVPKAQSKKIINTIKDGTCLFIYHPSKNYLNKSKLLNG